MAWSTLPETVGGAIGVSTQQPRDLRTLALWRRSLLLQQRAIAALVESLGFQKPFSKHGGARALGAVGTPETVPSFSRMDDVWLASRWHCAMRSGVAARYRTSRGSVRVGFGRLALESQVPRDSHVLPVGR